MNSATVYVLVVVALSIFCNVSVNFFRDCCPWYDVVVKLMMHLLQCQYMSKYVFKQNCTYLISKGKERIKVLLLLLHCNNIWGGEGWGRAEESCLSLLKWTVSRDFLLLVFFMNQFPPSPRVSHYDCFEFFWHRWQICHRCQRHRRKNCPRYQRHQWQICHRYQRHRWQILPPVLLIPTANNGNNIRLQIT